jgi:2-phosphosulfolactate phosphatase
MVSVAVAGNVRPVRVHVAFTPAEATRVPTGIVVDVLRATSTVVQALDSGHGAVYCCSEIDEARALAAELADAVLAGERSAELIPGFDYGNSPRDFLERRAGNVVLTTTNGTRAIVAAAGDCDVVFCGSLLNAEAVARAATEHGEDVEIVCAGFQGAFSVDDAYCAGRIVELLGGVRTEAAEEAVHIVQEAGSAEAAFRAARAAGETIDEEDLLWCARESVTGVVPRLDGLHGPAARLVSG